MGKRKKPVARILKLIGKDIGFNRTEWDRERLMKWERVKSDPFKSLIGTVLSQRTRDENTSVASRQLFSKYSTPRQIANAPLSEIERLIRPSGYYRVKSRRIKEISKIIMDKHGSKTPATMGELCSLPGVGRKTAGCVMVYSYGKPQIPVDTHVFRVSNRIGIVNEKTPDKTEQALMKAIPRKYWLVVNELFVTFGKKICKPIGPKHDQCPVRKYCDFYNSIKKKKSG
jgi:endonuclease-3